MLSDVKALSEFTSIDYKTDKPLETGKVGRLAGFDVYEFEDVPRATLNAANGATSVSAVGKHDATKSSTTAAVALFTCRSAVRVGMTRIKTYIDRKNPLVQGDVFSAALYGGSTTTHPATSHKVPGVALLVEGS